MKHEYQNSALLVKLKRFKKEWLYGRVENVKRESAMWPVRMINILREYNCYPDGFMPYGIEFKKDSTIVYSEKSNEDSIIISSNRISITGG